MKPWKLASAVTVLVLSTSANATLVSNAVLDFYDGIGACLVGGIYPDCINEETTTSGGSYFALDANGDGILNEVERAIMANAGTGLTLNAAQTSGEIDQTLLYKGFPTDHYTQGAGPTVESSSGNTASIDMSGWTMWFDHQSVVDVGVGSNATVICGIDCSVGDTFTLDYSAIIQEGGFTGFLYGLHLEGTIAAVPVPAAIWLFGSGLLGLVGVARKKKA